MEVNSILDFRLEGGNGRLWITHWVRGPWRRNGRRHDTRHVASEPNSTAVNGSLADGTRAKTAELVPTDF